MSDPALIGSYTVLSELGRGGMGVVYKARAVNGAIVALKLLLTSGADADERTQQRFEREARICQELNHPNLIQVLDFSRHNGRNFLALEWIDGVSLEEKLRLGPLSSEDVARMGGALAEGLQAAHDRGVLHRDVKPANVLLEGERVILTDFGIALDAAEELERLTKTGTLVGSPSYMAPEQIEGKSSSVGAWSDVYSLGATLYEALTGRPPYLGASLLDVLSQVARGSPPPPTSLQANVNPALSAICLRCLETDPADRYSTARALADDLYAFLAQSRSSPEPEGPPSRDVSSRRLAIALWALVGGLLLLLGWVLFNSYTTTKPSPRPSLERSPTTEGSPPPPAAAGTPQPPLDPVSAAQRAFSNGSWRFALKVRRGRLEGAATRAEILVWPRTQFREGGPSAGRALRRALAKSPDDPSLLALSYFLKPTPAVWERVRSLSGARSARALLIEGWRLRGKSLGNADPEPPTAAIRYFDAVLALEPLNRWAHSGRVLVHLRLARIAKSTESYSRLRVVIREAQAALPGSFLMTYRLAQAYKCEAEDRTFGSPRERLATLNRGLKLMNEVAAGEPTWARVFLERSLWIKAGLGSPHGPTGCNGDGPIGCNGNGPVGCESRRSLWVQPGWTLWVQRPWIYTPLSHSLVALAGRSTRIRVPDRS
ncbi:MAG: serine/threonine protein kinase [Planctomycetes bacterium]|nr:serine/threonine protein kinase [Planctomycetota bacterium]